jgi:hypothetical protein
MGEEEAGGEQRRLRGKSLVEGDSPMVTLELGPYSKARVWLGEQPELRSETVQILRRSVALPGGVPGRAGLAAGEVWRYVGGRCEYALLGAEFLPLPDIGRMEVRVAVSRDEQDPVPWALGTSYGDVARAGLTAEYAPTVLEGACEADALRQLGCGILSFECAAVADMYSAPARFQRLASIVVRLLSLDPKTTTEADLLELLQSSNWTR